MTPEQSTVQSPADALTQLKTLVGEYYDIRQAQSLAHWDMQTCMPEQGSGPRSRMLVTLGKISHEALTSDPMREALEVWRRPEQLQSLSETDRALVLEMTERFDKAVRIPLPLVQRFDEACARGFNTWVKARKEDNFELFRPTLAELVDLSRQRAEAMGYEADPYDALLDEYEKGLTVAQLDPLFEELKAELTRLVQAIQQSGKTPETPFPGKTFPADAQLAFCQELLKAIGYDLSRGRMDQSVHPFTTEPGGSMDVRITVRHKTSDPLESIATALHEGGHALYEQGVDEAYLGTPLGNGTSLGIHESQSRLWENNIGRSRLFWDAFYPSLQKHFPEQLKGVSVEAFHRHVNRVTPSLIRTEADEVTYNLHILLRYELEKDLIHGRLPVREIPGAWNAKLKDFLGITPDTAANGCLQDVHWSEGMFGYFPTYTLGNLYAAQIFRTAKTQLPDLEGRMARGELLPLKHWLNEKVHHHGKAKTPDALIREVTGEPLNPRYFIDYLWEKYGSLYGISRS